MSERESGVPADKLDLDDRGKLLPDIGTDLAERSRTLVIGPCDVRKEVADEPEAGEEADVFGLNAVMDCDTPSARMNCSRSSMLVRPLARQGSFFNKNSSNAIHPPPTRTITVLRRIRTSRNFWLSPNLYFPSPTWNTRNFWRQVHNITRRLTSSCIF